MAAFLCVLGLAVIISATRISENLARTGVIGPKVVPFLIGGLLVFVSIMLAINILRGRARRGRKVRKTSICPSAATG